jgi:cytochrome c-type biogenesis protein CcmH/NrfF
MDLADLFTILIVIPIVLFNTERNRKRIEQVKTLQQETNRLLQELLQAAKK